VTDSLLSLRGLSVWFPVGDRLFGRKQMLRAVEGVDLELRAGEALGIVGESGCGKSTLARAVLQLVRPTHGQVVWMGRRIEELSLAEVRPLRRDMQIVFQDPYSSLDPRQRIGSIVEEPLKLDRALSRAARRARVEEVFGEVGLPLAFLERLPHQLSGGQRQRVAIARAIVRRPAFVVADEPVSALDMTVQKQILLLIRSLQARYGFACLFVSHDLGAVEQVADRVAVMEDGRIVELGDRDAVFDAPAHPYTRRLLDAAMLLDRNFSDAGRATEQRA
jgi:peptide/nickel transport system ATP-binding protein